MTQEQAAGLLVDLVLGAGGDLWLEKGDLYGRQVPPEFQAALQAYRAHVIRELQRREAGQSGEAPPDPEPLVRDDAGNLMPARIWLESWQPGSGKPS